MMQQSASVPLSNSFSPLLPKSLPLAAVFRNRFPFLVQFPSLTSRQNKQPIALPPLRSAATENIVKTSKTESEFVEVGYASGVHGLQGEICVKPSTDFPELRFAQPGRRWLKRQASGVDVIQEVELVEGRGHPGQKSWILKFKGIDMVDQAKLLVGSTLLVREEDRPELEEGEFYTRDLVGMRVFLKETGELIGTVVNVFNSGANDLLEVMLDSSANVVDKTIKSNSAERKGYRNSVWVPFVEAIVPDIDIKKREMHITPPKGLLELNLQTDERSKKERQQLEWKERKKFQKRLISAKKQLCEMKQKHVFDGFGYGEKAQRSFLAEEIVSLNSKLLRGALQNVEIPEKRWTLAELVAALETKQLSSIQVSEDCLFPKLKEKLGGQINLQGKGLNLLSKGKMAVILSLNGNETMGSTCNQEATEKSASSILQELLCDDEKFVKMEDRPFVPIILVCPADEIEDTRELFAANDQFAFDSKKIWFLKEETLPVVRKTMAEEYYKILMKSPWEILKSPVGSGGAISLLSSHNMVDTLSSIGVEYVEVGHPINSCVGANTTLAGYVNSREADIGIQIFENKTASEEGFDMIFSVDFLKMLTRQLNKLQFNVIPKANCYVEKVDKDWVNVTSCTPNSCELTCSIYGSLNACSLDKVCVMEVIE